MLNGKGDFYPGKDFATHHRSLERPPELVSNFKRFFSRLSHKVANWTGGKLECVGRDAMLCYL